MDLYRTNRIRLRRVEKNLTTSKKFKYVPTIKAIPELLGIKQPKKD